MRNPLVKTARDSGIGEGQQTHRCTRLSRSREITPRRTHRSVVDDDKPDRDKPSHHHRHHLQTSTQHPLATDKNPSCETQSGWGLSHNRMETSKLHCRFRIRTSPIQRNRTTRYPRTEPTYRRRRSRRHLRRNRNRCRSTYDRRTHTPTPPRKPAHRHRKLMV